MVISTKKSNSTENPMNNNSSNKRDGCKYIAQHEWKDYNNIHIHINPKITSSSF